MIAFQNAIQIALANDEFENVAGLLEDILKINPQDQKTTQYLDLVVKARRLQTAGDLIFAEGNYSQAIDYYRQVENIKKQILK